MKSRKMGKGITLLLASAMVFTAMPVSAATVSENDGVPVIEEVIVPEAENTVSPVEETTTPETDYVVAPEKSLEEMEMDDELEAETVTVTSGTTEDGLEYEVVEAEDGSQSITITKYSGNATEVSVPVSINEIPVTSIGEDAFYFRRGLKSITIPNTIINIGESAFFYCSSLTSIAIPDSVTSIEKDVFYHCSSLANITIPNSVTSIGEGAFGGCSSLTNITIPNSVTSIGRDAFGTCSSLTDITIPNSVASIEEYAFSYCSSLKSITIPDSVTSIGEYAFYDCSSLKSITIPNSVTSIGEGAFYGCNSLIEVRIDDIGAWLSISFSDSYSNPFYANIEEKKLYIGGELATSIIIPNTITSIGEYAFIYCSCLASITIPNSVTSIGQRAFWGCSNLTEVRIDDLESWLSISFSDLYSNPLESNYREKKLYIGGELATNIIIPNTITSIGECAFGHCSSLTSITIPNSVTGIGEYAFSECKNLTEVRIDDVQSWLNISFGSLNANPLKSNDKEKKLYIGGELATSITIPNGVTSIGNYAFSDCSSLTSITIPDSVTSIGVGAFSECKNLTEVRIDDLESWLSISFGHSSANPLKSNDKEKKLYIGGELATSITIPNGVTSIGNSAFRNCSSLTSIIIPDSVTSIGESVFEGCSSLSSVIYQGSECDFYFNITTGREYIPSKGLSFSNNKAHSFTEIIETTGNAKYTCRDCGASYSLVYYTENGNSVICGYSGNDIHQLVIPNAIDGRTVISIAREAFRDSSSLTSISISNSVTSIGNGAFRDCSSLTSISIPDSVTSIWNDAFRDCSSLTSITIPNGVTSIRFDTFRDCSSLTSITIPESVTRIAAGAFEGCSSLTSITIPESVTSIENYVFSGCSSLTNITIPDGVKSVGDFAFEGCSNLTSITIPENVTSIGPSAFKGCSSLTSITIPDSVTVIGDSAFYNCYSLTSITIPNNVTIIGVDALGKYYSDVDSCTKNVDGFIIHCGSGSAAEKYAIGNDISYHSIHTYGEWETTKEATCTENGSKKRTCLVCGAEQTATIVAKWHTYGEWVTTKEATCTETGSKKRTCSVCGAEETETINTIKVAPAKTSGVTLENASKGIKISWNKVNGATGYYVYRGNTKVATIKSGDTVNYTDTKATKNGKKYSYTVVAYTSTEKGAASDAVTIYHLTAPSISSVSNSTSKKMTVKWKKNKKATGYEIKYVTGKKTKTVKVSKASSVSKVIGGLTKSKTYKVYIRSYKKVGKTTYYSKWSGAKRVKIKK